MSFIYFSLVAVAAWFVSYFAVYHFTLLLFKVIMPLKRKHGEKLTFKILVSIPFFVGFLLDIYWNIVHFSFELWMMNRLDKLDKKFWPEFSKVTSVKNIYKITLTDRLQKILDEYPLDSRAYLWAFEMRELLNKYDPDHLTLRAYR